MDMEIKRQQFLLSYKEQCEQAEKIYEKANQQNLLNLKKAQSLLVDALGAAPLYSYTKMKIVKLFVAVTIDLKNFKDAKAMIERYTQLLTQEKQYYFFKSPMDILPGTPSSSSHFFPAIENEGIINVWVQPELAFFQASEQIDHADRFFDLEYHFQTSHVSMNEFLFICETWKEWKMELERQLSNAIVQDIVTSPAMKQ